MTLACELHRTQARKGTQIPYVAHLVAVASIALEHGADEDEAIAAVLHDAVEDQGGAATAEAIERQFGARVADIVRACSDTDVTPKPPWLERKRAYLAHIAKASPSARLVSASDKLHNARAILADYREHKGKLWERFNGGREGTLWYYRALVDAFRESPPSGDGRRLVEELDRVVRELENLASHFPPGTSKWNKVEHRLFSFISINWRGRPLRTYETVINLIGKTTNRAEAIRTALGMQAKEMLRILKEGVAKKKLSTKGQKRATTYFTK